jgi:arylsulfatase A-like enzyme
MRALLILALCVTITLAAERSPDIVFILADDLGITDINTYARHFTDAKTDELLYDPPTSTNSSPTASLSPNPTPTRSVLPPAPPF